MPDVIDTLKEPLLNPQVVGLEFVVAVTTEPPVIKTVCVATGKQLLVTVTV